MESPMNSIRRAIAAAAAVGVSWEERSRSNHRRDPFSRGHLKSVEQHIIWNVCIDTVEIGLCLLLHGNREH